MRLRSSEDGIRPPGSSRKQSSHPNIRVSLEGVLPNALSLNNRLLWLDKAGSTNDPLRFYRILEH